RIVRLGFFERLAATYSRGVYKTTTIGKTVFDGRVRNGNGSDHSFMATKNWEVRAQKSEIKNLTSTSESVQNVKERIAGCSLAFSENCTKDMLRRIISSRVEIALFPRGKEEAIKPHDRLVLVR